MDDTGMTLADKLAYIDEVREVFGEEAAADVARRFGLEVSPLPYAEAPGRPSARRRAPDRAPVEPGPSAPH